MQQARLIPVSGIGSEKEAEQRATSALLAVFTVVRDLSSELFAPLGASRAQKATVQAWTEVQFDHNGRKIRPDGLPQVSYRQATWSALLEVKTGDATLDADHNPPPSACVRSPVHSGPMPKTVPVREFRSHLADLLDEVADRREHVTITRHGRPSAVVIPLREYEALEETAEILSDDDTLAAIRRGLDDLTAGDEVELDEVRKEMADRERS